ncbi:hypothetical protein FOZ63_014644, partial [Perkinsus olseni]
KHQSFMHLYIRPTLAPGVGEALHKATSDVGVPSPSTSGNRASAFHLKYTYDEDRDVMASMSSSLPPLVVIDDNKKKFARRQSTASTIGMGGLEVDVDAVDRAGQAGAHGSVYTRYLSQFYKTKLCKYHLDGYCNRGDNCTHAHSVSELECQPDLSKARMCRTLLQKGHCDVTNCAYAHDLET